MDSSVQTAIHNLMNIQKEKETSIKKRKQAIAGEEEWLEKVKEHMQNNHLNCLGMGPGRYAVLEAHKVKPSLNADMAGFLFQEFMKQHAATPVNPQMKQAFITFVTNSISKMTEIDDYKIKITKKRPAESFSLKN